MDRLSVNHTETEHELELVLSTKGLGVFDDIGSCTLCCIVSYLSIADVTALQLTNKYFRSFCSSKLVWSLIHRKNFQVESVDSPSRSISSPQCSSTNQECTKEQFIERYRNYSIRIQQGKGWDVEAQEETLRAARVHGMENFLDMTQVRLIIPLILASVILTITLFARKVDGLEISYWVCFVPLLVALIYMSLSFYLLKVLHKYEGSPKLILRGIWDNFRGPVMFVYREILGSHLRLVYAMLGLLAVFIIQVLLVATKLSTTTPSELNAHYLPWPVVFIPIWLCLVLYCALPLFVRNIDAGAFLSLMCLFVVPTLIFFVCLTVKLSGAQENSPQRKIRLALMLIPFWILEGVVMLGSLLFLLIGIHRYALYSFCCIEYLFFIRQMQCN